MFGTPPVAPPHATFNKSVTSLSVIAQALGNPDMKRHMRKHGDWVYLTHRELGWNAVPIEAAEDYRWGMLCGCLEDVSLHQYVTLDGRRLTFQHPELGTFSAPISELKSQARARSNQVALHYLVTKYRTPGG